MLWGIRYLEKLGLLIDRGTNSQVAHDSTSACRNSVCILVSDEKVRAQILSFGRCFDGDGMAIGKDVSNPNSVVEGGAIYLRADMPDRNRAICRS